MYWGCFLYLFDFDIYKHRSITFERHVLVYCDEPTQAYDLVITQMYDYYSEIAKGGLDIQAIQSFFLECGEKIWERDATNILKKYAGREANV